MYGLILIPAYGRDYATTEACQADWISGKDFKILDGPYCSIRDASHIIAAGFRSLYLVNGEGRFMLEADLSQHSH